MTIYICRLSIVNFKLSIINIILFDGLCNLCNSSVQFVIKHDPKAVYRFASLQSEVGQKLLLDNGISITNNDLSSFILLENNIVFTESTAALRVARNLNGLLPLLYFAIIIPLLIRNAVYKFISKNRYKWFGKRNECWIPTVDLKNRFLD